MRRDARPPCLRRRARRTARVGGRAEHPLLVVVGHIDEIALLISHVSDKGFLHVVGSGGWDPQVLVGQRVEVFASPVGRAVVPDNDLGGRARGPCEHVLDALAQQIDAVVRQHQDRDATVGRIGDRRGGIAP